NLRTRPPGAPMTTPALLPSIVKTVTVPLDPPQAFDLFTSRIGEWWPLESHSVGGSSSAGIVLDESGAVETLGDGSTSRWGDVIDWEPPYRFSMTWHPGASPG